VLLTAQFDAPFAGPLVAQNAETTAPATMRKAKQQTRKDPETREIGVTRRPTSLHRDRPVTLEVASSRRPTPGLPKQTTMAAVTLATAAPPFSLMFSSGRRDRRTASPWKS
jgi:hypothetical protein